MRICGLQKLTLLDFPKKTACTVFLGGCNFRCPFCHNGNLAEGILDNQIPEDELFSFLKKRSGLLDGVCITGGEPTLNPDLEDFIKEIKSFGYSVKLDSNGTNPKLLKSLLEKNLIDYIAMDIKNSKDSYPETCGVENLNIKDIEESVEIIKNSGIDYEFRTTVVSQFHTTEEIEKMGKWLKGAKKYFLQSFRDSEFVLKKGLTAPKKEELESYRDLLTGYIDFVDIRGID